jgi:hypothetical protein
MLNTNGSENVEEINGELLRAVGLGPKIFQLIADDLENILGDSSIKMVRQLQFSFQRNLNLVSAATARAGFSFVLWDPFFLLVCFRYRRAVWFLQSSSRPRQRYVCAPCVRQRAV